MPHRDDLAAAHARIAALERELAAAQKESRARLRCVRCREAFEPRDLHGKSGQLTCRGCRAIVEAARPPARRRPHGLDVDDRPDELRIAWRWQLAPREAIAAIILAALLAAALATGAVDEPVLVVAVIGLGALFVALCFRLAGQMFNRTLIRVTDRRLRIDVEPVALQRYRSLPADELDQLYCVAVSSRDSTWYQLWAELAGGKRSCLVGEIADVERAFFLEREIERRLGIADRPVRGEVPRRD